MAILTTSAYKAWAGITAATLDTLIGETVTRVQDAIETYCGRKFDSATVTEYLSGTGSPCILLARPPITAFTSITILHSADSSTAYDTADLLAENFRWDEEANRGKVCWINSRRGRFTVDEWGALNPSRFGASPAFPEGFRNIKAIYTGGFSSETMPPALKQIACKLVAREIGVASAKPRDPAVKSFGVGQWSETRADQVELDEQDRRWLSPYVLARSMVG